MFSALVCFARVKHEMSHEIGGVGIRERVSIVIGVPDTISRRHFVVTLSTVKDITTTLRV